MKKSSLLFLSAVLTFAAAAAPARAETPDYKYLDEFEGLHITGTPVDVDIETYRLTVTGKVRKELSLKFDDVKNMKSVDKKIVLNCPGFFTDIGTWTGVPARVLLEMAGLRPDAKVVIFATEDESYRTRFPVEEVMAADGMLIAYRFNAGEFHRVHGFPLRLAADGKEGSDWVKWLGKIIVE